MSDDAFEIDPEMMADFIDESLDSLSVIPGLFVELEGSPDNLKVIEAIFRPVHSLKGNATYFGLMKTKALTHDLETVLDLLRKSRLRANKSIIDGLLAGIDVILLILDRTRNQGVETVDEEQYKIVHSRVKELAQSQEGGAPKPVVASESDVDKWHEVWTGLKVLEIFPPLKGNPEEEVLNQIMALIATMAPAEVVGEGGLPVSDNDVLASFHHFLQNLPKDMPKNELAEQIKRRLGDLKVIAGSDEASSLIDKTLEDFEFLFDKIGFDPILIDSINEAINALGLMQSWTTTQEEVEAEPEPVVPEEESEPETPEIDLAEEPPVQAEVVAATPAKEARADAQKKEPGRTMRVSEDSIDAFLGYVGELIAVDEMFRYIHGKMVQMDADLGLSSDLLRVINTFTKLSDDLQRSIMDIRRVPVKPLLQRSQRIVRDVASNAGKQIETRLIGEEITIDRSLMETLEAPMVHMVRNAADHGIEMPEDRLDSGKKEKGTITVEVYEEDDRIIMSIRDDGQGLNYDKIQAKALKQGLLQEDDEPTETELAEMIFAPGFSTAEKVTDVSGRGVGMDAVKQGIESAGGLINLSSKTGRGSEFRISLPSTVGTQILNSFVVRIEHQRVVLPMDRISGSFKPEPQHFHYMPDGSVCIRRNQTILPVLSLAGTFSGDARSLQEGILITIESKSKPFAFYVDSIIGMQKVVLRSIPWVIVDKFLGAAVMGDGKVSMIVDIDSLEKLVA